MIDTDTLARLRAMRLSGMAQCFEQIAETPGQANLTAPEVVKMAIEWEWERRQNSKLTRLRRQAALAQPQADAADIRTIPGRTLDTEMITRLAVGTYITKHQDLVLQGPTGSGKTYVACALANKACQQFHTALYLPAAELFDRLRAADRAGDRPRVMDTL
ncbi:MAG: ATP-binding protein, partial [Bifidobacteriaceae bacterium]|nr:ATP-binding protein [Bifidobacteriaceae bacterium]